MRIYLVWSGEYSDKRVECVTTDREKAEKYAALMNNEYLAEEQGDYYYDDDYRVEERDTDSFPDISSTLDFAEKNRIVYGWMYRNSYNPYGKDRIEIIERCYFPNENRNIVSKGYGKDSYVVHVLADTEDLAWKIARDIIAKHRAMIEGIA